MSDFVVDADFRKFNLETLGLKTQKRLIDKTEVVPAKQEDVDLLYRCLNYWNNLSDFRERRERARKYLRGDQLSDKITDPDCPSRKITQKEHIERQGMIAFKNNQIRQLVKNVMGQYRSNETKPMVVARHKDASKESEMMTMAVRYAHQINMVDELDARNFEEFLVSGGACAKVNYRYWKTRNIDDCYITNVGLNRLFFNTDVRDVRMQDLRVIGEIIDLSRDELVGLFAKTPAEKAKIEGWYHNTSMDYVNTGKGLSADREDAMNFLAPHDTSLCRFYEIWQLQSEWRLKVYDPLHGTYATYKDVSMQDIAEANRQRIERGLEQGVEEATIPLIEAEPIFEQFWYVKYLTPSGNVLFETETPFAHEEHPYALLLYPLIDGEVWGFIEDIIDQQRYVNRMITLLDASIGMGMKNLLLVPEDAIPDDMDLQDFADEWTKINGVVVYKAKPGVAPPHQVSASSTNMGAHDLLALQMKMMQDISGVHGAIQGQSVGANTPSSLYAQQSQNAALNLLDSFEVFSAFRQRRDEKVLKLIKQYYREPRYLAISGRMYSQEANMYEPDRVRDMDFDLVITQSLDTPAFKQMTDDLLMKLFELQAIPVELFLENTSMPMAQNLLQSLNAYKEKMQSQQMQGQMPQGAGNPMGQGAEMSPEMLEQMRGQIQSNPQAMAMMEQMLK